MTKKQRFREEKTHILHANMSIADLIFILIFVFLFLAVILSIYRQKTEFLFQQSQLGASIFAILSSSLISYYFIIWGFFKIKYYVKTIEGRKGTVSKAFRFVGLAKPSFNEIVYILFSTIIGVIVSIFSLYLMSNLINGALRLASSIDISIMLQNIIVVPIFEEVIYRGIYLSVFQRIFEKNYTTAILGLILSSFTFGWIHPTMPLLKALAGFVLGSIYLYRWKKNLVASVFAHLGANIVATFVLVEVVLP